MGIKSVLGLFCTIVWNNVCVCAWLQQTSFRIQCSIMPLLL